MRCMTSIDRALATKLLSNKPESPAGRGVDRNPARPYYQGKASSLKVMRRRARQQT